MPEPQLPGFETPDQDEDPISLDLEERIRRIAASASDRVPDEPRVSEARHDLGGHADGPGRYAVYQATNRERGKLSEMPRREGRLNPNSEALPARLNRDIDPDQKEVDKDGIIRAREALHPQEEPEEQP